MAVPGLQKAVLEGRALEGDKEEAGGVARKIGNVQALIMKRQHLLDILKL